MNRLFLFLSLFLLHAGVNAQGVRLGVCLNPHINWMTENSSTIRGAGSRMGIEGGLVFENYFTRNYAIYSGVRLGSYGAKVSYNSPQVLKINDTERTVLASDVVIYKLQYLTTPLGLKLKTNEIGYFSYYALVGLTPQLRVGAKATLRGQFENASVTKEVSIFNLAYNFGGGIEYGLGGNSSLVGGIIYNHGFLDILKRQGDKESLAMIALHVGIMF